MSDAELGHEHVTPQGVVLVLNRSWLEDQSPQQIEGYIATVTRLAASGHDDVAHLAEVLREELDAVGVQLAPPSYERTAEQLLGSQQVQVLTDDGKVLYSDPGISTAPPADRDPDVEGTEDPEAPHRPPLGT